MPESTGHWFGAKGKGSKGRGHPIMYGKPKPAIQFNDFPEGGGYPKGFLEWAYVTMGCYDMEVLHLCSGSVRTGTTVDIRPECRPTFVADCRATGLPDETFDYILADPPYAKDYAENLYGTGKDYPKPGEILREAARLLRPGGRVGILHFIVPMTRRPLKMMGVWGITTGAGYAIRAWSLFEKLPRTSQTPEKG